MTTTEGDDAVPPPPAKRAKVKSETVPDDDLAHQDVEARSILLAAGRISSWLSRQRHDESRHAVAWSSDNLIALSSGNNVALAHVSKPQRVHSLACKGDGGAGDVGPNVLTFSPSGDALFACLPSGLAYLWTRGAALNRWRLVSGKAMSSPFLLPGKVVEAQWLAQPRRRGKDYRRTYSCGPQFSAGGSSTEVALLTMCEDGHVALIHADVQSQRLSLHTIPIIPPLGSERVSHAAVGLLPDEPRAVLACRVARTSKSMPSGSAPADDALGMFFRDEVASTPFRLEDGQEKFHLFELKIDFNSQEATVAARPLAPIFVGQEPLRMFWTGTSPLNLVVAFDSPTGSVLKAWQLKRRQINKLSDAFASLEAAKARPLAGSSTDEEDDSNEEWMAEQTKSRALERRKLCEVVVASHSDRILCVTVPWQQWPLNGDETSTAVEQTCVLDSLTLDVADDYEALKCKPAVQSRMTLSPNDVLVAAITAEGRPSLFRSPKGMWASDNKGLLLVLSFLQENDYGDLSMVLQGADVVKDSVKCFGMAQPPKASQQLRLLELRLAVDGCRRSRLFLELARFFRLSREARVRNHYDLGSVPALLASIAWLHALVEDLARTAYLLCDLPSNANGSSTDAGADDGRDDGENDTRGEEEDATATSGRLLLGLLTLSIPRKVVVDLTRRVRAFRNWLLEVTTTAEGLRPLLEDEENLKRQPPTIDDVVALARAQLCEIEARSQVSLDGLALLLEEEEKAQSGEEEKEAWYGRKRLSRGRRAEEALGKRIAQSKGTVIKDLLLLFVGDEEEERLGSAAGGVPKPSWFDNEGGRLWSAAAQDATSRRDIISKAPLLDYEQRLTCIRCGGQTALSGSIARDKCLCGGAWWA